MKKILSMLLASAMLVSAFTACGSSSKEESKSESSKSESSKAEESSEESTDESSKEEATEKKEIKFTMLFADDVAAPYSEDWLVWDFLKDSTGLVMDPMVVPVSDFDTKKNLLINTGDVPDVLARSFGTAKEAFSGQFLAVDEMIVDMPNFNAYMEACGYTGSAGIERYKLADGHIYAMPFECRQVKIQNNQWAVRTDIFEANNLEIPTNLDELYDVSMQLKEIYPDSTPITNRYGSFNLMGGLGHAFDTLAGRNIESGMDFDAEKDEFFFAIDTQNWKDMVTYTNKLYTSGALDQEYSAQDPAVFLQKLSADKAFICFDWQGFQTQLNKDNRAANPDFTMSPIKVLEGVEGYEGHYATTWCNSWTKMIMFGATLKERDDYADFVQAWDWLYTDEAELLFSFGTPDMYEEVDGMIRSIDSTLDKTVTGLTNENMIARSHPDLPYASMDIEDAKALKEIYEDMTAKNAVENPIPVSPLSADEVEHFSVTITNLKDYINQMMEGFIAGTESIDDYDAFVQGCYDKGAQELLDAMNTARAAMK